MPKQLRQTWDLESIFPGGSASPALTGHLDEQDRRVEALRTEVSANPDIHDRTYWYHILEEIQHLRERQIQGSAFIGCLTSQDVKDREAKRLYGRALEQGSGLESIMTLLESQLLKLSDEEFAELVTDERLRPIAFPLKERRASAKRKMAPEKEMLVNDLSVDGYHSWWTLYDTIVGRMTVPVETDGKAELLSVGQAANKLYEPDRAVRTHVFEKWTATWDKEAELCASVLNHLSGYRLALYKHRGWESFLQEPLTNNRMSEATLTAMWDAVATSKSALVKYYQRKAKLTGWESVNWYDLYAPLSSTVRKVPYDEAAEFIIQHFRRFSPDMADFAASAFEGAWIEVEDRPGKAPGGYCTSLPLNKESRIFMTYAGDMGGVSTLAHELGHAYHSHVMMDLPPFTQDYAMNVAETASTFAEMLINAAAIAGAQSKEEKLGLLDTKIADAASYLMNIHARFLFETRFYTERKQGMVSIERLNELMETAQKEAYAGALGQYNPSFWASKLHFYATDAPFYNFPYTFGFLFSSGIYARALKEGPAFEQRYVALLRDTGRMTVEELAARHLGVDLTKPDFWLSGVGMVVADIEEYLKLTE